jgi:hypothetical protein
MITKQRTSLVVAMAVVIVTGFASSALCQEESFVFSEEFFPLDASTFHGGVGFEDYSECPHSGYWQDLWVTGPNGGFNQSSGYGNTEVTIPYNGDGDYPLSSSLSVEWCGCGGEGHGAGGGGVIASGGDFIAHYILGGEAPTYYYYFREVGFGNAHRCARDQAAWSARHDDITLHGIWGDTLGFFACIGTCDPQRFGTAHGPAGDPPGGIQNCRTP